MQMDREAWPAAVHGVSRVGHDRATEVHWMIKGYFPFTVIQNSGYIPRIV